MAYGWKVINSMTRTSVVARNKYKGAVKYVKGVATHRKPKCGPLAVFKDFVDAVEFCRVRNFYGYRAKVVRCRYKKSKDQELWDAQGLVMRDLPLGTDFADHVTCLE